LVDEVRPSGMGQTLHGWYCRQCVGGNGFFIFWGTSKALMDADRSQIYNSRKKFQESLFTMARPIETRRLSSLKEAMRAGQKERE